MNEDIVIPPTPLYDYDKQCKGKVKYETPTDALFFCHSVVKKERRPFTVYECPYCRSYHVGSVPVI